MSIFGARASDWHSGRPDVRVGYWIAGIIGAAVLYYVVAAIIGSIVVGNGSPLLTHGGPFLS